jgi:hypothetical protein
VTQREHLDCKVSATPSEVTDGGEEGDDDSHRRSVAQNPVSAKHAPIHYVRSFRKEQASPASG